MVFCLFSFFHFFKIVFRAVVENDERFVEKTYSEKCRAEYFQTGATLFLKFGYTGELLL